MKCKLCNVSMLCVTIKSKGIEGYAYECPQCNNLRNLVLSEITVAIGQILNNEAERRNKLREVQHHEM